MKQKVCVTAALLYANGNLHIGHLAGCYLPADIYARFCRLNGWDVLFISGSDEYGGAITLSAEVKGVSPQEHIDYFHPKNKQFFSDLSISFDYYGRTTNKFHADLTREFFLELLSKGYIEKNKSYQLYSEKEDKFLADRYVLGTCPRCGYDQARGDECTKCGASFEAIELIKPISKMTKNPLIKKKTENWYLKLEKFKDQLDSWLKEKDWKKNVLNFSLPYIKELRSRSITRDLKWGVELPQKDLSGQTIEGIDGKVFYVWFDAPIGYISITQEWAEKKGSLDLWKDYWCDQKTPIVQFLGKDNIMFHSILFPSMVMGRNEGSEESINLVDQVAANEFLSLEGRQMSKSSGWFVDLEKFIKNYGAEKLRFYIASTAPEQQDTDFSWSDFQSHINGNLIGKFSNYIHRTFSFLYRFGEATIPSASYNKEFIGKIRILCEEIRLCYSKYQVRQAAEKIMEISHLSNTYFQNSKPWNLIKTDTGKKELPSVLFTSLLAAKYLALVASPIIPKTAELIWKMLKYSDPLENQNWSKIMNEKLNSGQKIDEPKVLFNRIEDEQILKERALLNAENQEEPKMEVKKEISFDDFMKLDIRVGIIESVEKVPKSKKLLKLSVNLGFEVRTIVSGIAEFYDESLVGTKVAVLLNLKPRKIMGIESKGMILAAGDDKNLELLIQNRVDVGSEIS